MKKPNPCLFALFALCIFAANFCCCTGQIQAQIIDFYATGAAGDGFLEGNINPPTGESGTGGIGLTGINFDVASNILHVDIEWGSINGFTDLSTDVDRLHLHGPTANSGTGAFGQTAPLMITLSNSASYNPSASAGSINDNFLLSNTEAQALLNEQTYINFHLSDSDTGVIRGYLLRTVPEPTGMVPVMLLTFSIITRRKRH